MPHGQHACIRGRCSTTLYALVLLELNQIGGRTSFVARKAPESIRKLRQQTTSARAMLLVQALCVVCGVLDHV